jgi:hypothetical protein
MKHGLLRRCSTVFLSTKATSFAVKSLSENEEERSKQLGQKKKKKKGRKLYETAETWYPRD